MDFLAYVVSLGAVSCLCSSTEHSVLFRLWYSSLR